MSLLAFATQGAGRSDEARLKALLSRTDATFFTFDSSHKIQSFLKLLKMIQAIRPELVVMEGTGIAGGLALILARLFWGIHYVVSSGDAVASFIALRHPFLSHAFKLYEKLLCCFSDGYMGWSPYLVGRALTYGAPRGMTAAGWADETFEFSDEARKKIRSQLGVSEKTIVVGIVGSLSWNKRAGFCYGYELVRAIESLNREDLAVLIVGGGDGLSKLKELAGHRIGKSVFFTDQIDRSQVGAYLCAMDVASLPQSVDQVGSFRYTTKLSEYLKVKLPVVTGQLPLAYDLDFNGKYLWRLPGTYPWKKTYLSALREFLGRLSVEEIHSKRSQIPDVLPVFNRDQQIEAVTAFINDVLKSAKAAD